MPELHEYLFRGSIQRGDVFQPIQSKGNQMGERSPVNFPVIKLC